MNAFSRVMPGTQGDADDDIEANTFGAEEDDETGESLSDDEEKGDLF